MDSFNGFIVSKFRHLIYTLGSSLFAMTAYRSEPTYNIYLFKKFQLGNFLIQERSKFGNKLQNRSSTTPLPISLLSLTINVTAILRETSEETSY